MLDVSGLSADDGDPWAARIHAGREIHADHLIWIAQTMGGSRPTFRRSSLRQVPELAGAERWQGAPEVRR